MKKPAINILGLSMISFLLSCKDGTHTNVSAPASFNLRFHASLADRIDDVNCDTPLTQLGSTAVEGQLLDLAIFIHGLEFLRADGTAIKAELEANENQNRNVVLLDFQNKDNSCSGQEKPTYTTIRGEIAEASEIVGVRFTLGIPPELNHLDPSTVKAPLNAASMFWGWQGGYKSMRFDVSPANGISRPSDPNFLGTNFFFHLGSTDCVGDPTAGESVSCARINQPVITLNDFDLDSDEVVIDLSALVSGLNMEVDVADTPGCMSAVQDVECGKYFENLGLDLSSGVTNPGLSQSVFRLR